MLYTRNQSDNKHSHTMYASTEQARFLIHLNDKTFALRIIKN